MVVVSWHRSTAGKRWCEIWLDQIGSRWDVLCELSLGTGTIRIGFCQGFRSHYLGGFQHRNGWWGARRFPYLPVRNDRVKKLQCLGVEITPMPKPGCICPSLHWNNYRLGVPTLYLERCLENIVEVTIEPRKVPWLFGLYWGLYYLPNYIRIIS